MNSNYAYASSRHFSSMYKQDNTVDSLFQTQVSAYACMPEFVLLIRTCFMTTFGYIIVLFFSIIIYELEYHISIHWYPHLSPSHIICMLYITSTFKAAYHLMCCFVPHFFHKRWWASFSLSRSVCPGQLMRTLTKSFSSSFKNRLSTPKLKEILSCSTTPRRCQISNSEYLNLQLDHLSPTLLCVTKSPFRGYRK